MLQKFLQGDKERACAALKDAVEKYVQYNAGRDVTHYMHIMYRHPEWLLAGEDNNTPPHVWNTQGGHCYCIAY